MGISVIVGDGVASGEAAWSPAFVAVGELLDMGVSVIVAEGVGVGVIVYVPVGGIGIRVRGSTPGGTTITPGV